MVVQIFGNKESARVRFALLTAEYEGVAIEHVHVAPKKQEGTDAEPYKSSFPVGKVPALIDGDVKLFEVIAVTSYLAALNHSASSSGSLLETAKNAIGLGKTSLLGSTVAEKASVLQWVSFATSELVPALGGWFQPIAGMVPYNKKHAEDSAALFKKLLSVAENHLLHNTFLVTERVTLADLFLTTIIQRGSQFVLDKTFFSSFPNVARHYNTLARVPAVATVCFEGKEPQLLDQAVTYTPPAKAEKPKAEKAAAAPKAEKKAAPKKEADDEEEDAAPAEPKAKHPLEALGNAKCFPLDELKRQYSNLDTPDALKWFDEHYDPQEYSLWHAVYKYPEELTQVFMSSNLITGFHSRLEGSRKYIFGNAGVYGTNNDSKIQGVYLIRGSDAIKAFNVAPDYESYDFKPLDWSKAEDRKLTEDVWKWEGSFDGKAFADGKTFK